MQGKMWIPEGALGLLLIVDMEKDERVNLVYGNIKVGEFDEALYPQYIHINEHN
jgi:hypothetical protein